jgi:hypothetical protein
MKYQKAMDVWLLSREERAQLQPGQWIFAGDPSTKGIWCGIGTAGNDVAAWYDNAKSRSSYHDYIRFLIRYAKAKG